MCLSAIESLPSITRVWDPSPIPNLNIRLPDKHLLAAPLSFILRIKKWLSRMILRYVSRESYRQSGGWTFSAFIKDWNQLKTKTKETPHWLSSRITSGYWIEKAPHRAYITSISRLIHHRHWADSYTPDVVRNCNKSKQASRTLAPIVEEYLAL